MGVWNGEGDGKGYPQMIVYLAKFLPTVLCGGPLLSITVSIVISVLTMMSLEISVLA